ncbi:MAG TPA: translation elongation factor G, partial [Lachnospiraceae bacterium]|nr:translation elongation factor G [Lachnospiraceae bacterium]
MKHINIGIVAHVDAGKTTLTEALLYKTGSIRHLGRVDAKDTFLDTNEQERERGITIFSKQARLRMGSLDITLVDTPGHVDFSAEAESVLQVLDYCILIISAADGIKGRTLTLWSLLKEYDIPTFIFVNKMDQPGASADAVMAELKDRLSDACLDVSHACIDRDGQDAEGGPGRPFSFTDEDYENIAMCDEGLMEEYLESMEPIDDERIAGLIRERKLFPVFFGSALKLEGVDGLMAGLSSYTLEDEYATDFAARVFKITRDPAGNRLTHIKILGGNLNNKDLIGEEKVQQIRIYSGDKFEAVASAGAGQIVAVTGLNETRMGMGLGALRGTNLPLMEPVLNYKVSADDGTDTAVLLKDLRILEEEDPQLIISYEEDVKEIRAAVMGEVQLEVLKRTVLDRFHVSVVFDTGTVVYKETVAEAVEGVGHYEPLRHYAEAHILISPMPRGSGITYDSVCSEDILDRNWQRLILTHLKERMHKGVLTGSVITDVKFTILTGRAHLKHTEGGDFRQATYRAVRQGLMSTRSILLEPYFFYRIELPSDSVGRAMTDLERMKGKPQAPMIEGDRAVLTGTAPAVCIRNYAKDLAAYTKGEGAISLSLAGYEECHNADEVIESMGYIPEADLRNSPDSVFCAHGAGFVVPWNEVRDYMHVESP